MSTEKQLRKDPIQGQIIHVYDGIEEADNELPTWWLITFFGAMIFALIYWVSYQSMGFADNPGAAFTKARLATMEQGTVTDEDLIAMQSDEPMVSQGKATFMKTCAACHASKAEGRVGPNLTDNAWLYGGNPSEIYQTISNGTKKGMPKWGPSLGAGAIKQVTAYILTLRNTNVPGKPPEGIDWTPPIVEEKDTKQQESP